MERQIAAAAALDRQIAAAAALDNEADERAASLQHWRATAVQTLVEYDNVRTSENTLNAPICLPECCVPV